MGLGFINKFYLTNIYGGDSEVFLSVWKPIKKEDGNYYWPPNTPIGGDLWVNNCIGLEEGKTVSVKIVRSKVETGIWLCCSNGDFLNEQWIYNYKHKEGDPIKNDNVIAAIDWLNKKGFDYSGLIDKNLAKTKIIN